MNSTAIVVYRGDKNREAEELTRKISGHVHIAKLCNLDQLNPYDLAYDFAIVVGGDGTVLKVAKTVDKPVLGFKAGRVGFLTSYTLGQVDLFLKDFLDGKLVREERWMLQVCTNDKIYNAINDVVVVVSSKKMAEFRLSFDGCSDLVFFSDGILASTPTGSTAYNLSLGGAIVSPSCEIIQIMPIAPYFLQNRSIIVPNSQNVRLWTNMVCDILVDGSSVEMGNEICFKKSDRTFSLLRPKYYDFFAVLKTKVGYGRGIPD